MIESILEFVSNIDVPDVSSFELPSTCDAGMGLGFSEHIGLAEQSSPTTLPFTLNEPSTLGVSVEEHIPPPAPPISISDWDWQGIAAVGCLAGLVTLNIYAACTYQGNGIPPSI